MALARNRRRERGVDYWPGFVDALSTLLLAFMFLLTVFVLAQTVLSWEINDKDEVMSRLNNQIAELTELLALEKAASRIWKTFWRICNRHWLLQRVSAPACKACLKAAQVRVAQ